MSTKEKVEHALNEEALSDLFMGKWPYHEPAAYMAPSIVPTNLERILAALSDASPSLPDLPARILDAVEEMVTTSEGLYCALEVVLHYLDGRQFLSITFNLDVDQIAALVRQHLPKIENEARASHPSWMGPTSETLWERIERVRRVLQTAHAIVV